MTISSEMNLLPAIASPAGEKVSPNPAVAAYFETLNAGNTIATSQLFAIDGILYPPFEDPIIGRGAIACYLEQEAQDLLLQPQSTTVQTLENGCTEYQVLGSVQTPLFSVNVEWQFILSPDEEIFVARIRLLASLRKLLHLRQQMHSV
jgi:hypothetical protein